MMHAIHCAKVFVSSGRMYGCCGYGFNTVKNRVSSAGGGVGARLTMAVEGGGVGLLSMVCSLKGGCSSGHHREAGCYTAAAAAAALCVSEPSSVFAAGAKGPW